MIQYILLLHLLREEDHQHRLYLQKFFDKYSRNQTVKPLLIDPILMVIEPPSFCNNFHGFLVHIIVDLYSQHFMEVVEAGDGVSGAMVQGTKDLLNEVEGFKLFLNEGQQMVYSVWYQVSVFLLLHNAFVGLSPLVWSIVIVTSSLPSTLFHFVPLVPPFRPLRSFTFFCNVQLRRQQIRLLNGITRRGAFFNLRDIFPDDLWLFLKGIGGFIGIGKLLAEGISSYQYIVEGKIELSNNEVTIFSIVYWIIIMLRKRSIKIFNNAIKENEYPLSTHHRLPTPLPNAIDYYSQ